ncbi:MAG: hypothetical protein LH679_15215, partial [Cyanobacteria bacterium CAN_BIN43]|nr:hypothetical protein [Cyanobacteria bacterium CAN_BIN43]
MTVNPSYPNLVEAEGESPASLLRVAKNFDIAPNQPFVPESSATDSAATDLLWLTDEILFNHQRCRRRSYLELYEDYRLRDRPS